MAAKEHRWTILVAAAMVLAGCGDDGATSTPTTTPPTTTTQSTTAPTTAPATPTTVPATTAPAERIVVATYFSSPDGFLVAGSRAVPKSDAARAALAAVIDGPNAEERAAGYSSAIPSGTVLRSVGIDQRKATVDVSNAYTTGGGSLSMRLRVAQIVYTLTRLGSVDSVRFMIDGKAVDSIGGEGLIVTDVKPGEFDDLLPPVVVEFPTPGAAVAPGFVFRGLANVFEGTVNFELLDANATVIVQGFATGMMGAWGQFQATVAFPARPAGPLVFSVFTLSPKDGKRQNEARIPVHVT